MTYKGFIPRKKQAFIGKNIFQIQKGVKQPSKSVWVQTEKKHFLVNFAVTLMHFLAFYIFCMKKVKKSYCNQSLEWAAPELLVKIYSSRVSKGGCPTQFMLFKSANLVTVFVKCFLSRIVMATKQLLKHWIAIHQQFVTSILQRKRQE